MGDNYSGEITAYEVTEAMIQSGGSFVQALGRLFRQADPNNQRRLREAFHDYFHQYREIYEMRRGDVYPAAPPQETK
jgi:hypothetical protein